MLALNDPNAPRLANWALWGIGGLLFISGGLLPRVASLAYDENEGHIKIGRM